MFQELLPKEALLDATITPSPPNKLGKTSKSPRKNPLSQAPNSSGAPRSEAPSLCALCGRGEQQESGWAAGSGGGPGPPEGRESAGEAGHCLEVEDSSWATSDGPQRACDSVPLEASSKSAKGSGASGEPPDPFGHAEEEERKTEEEDSEYNSSVLWLVDVAFSEHGGADVAHELKQVNLACPKDFGVPGEGPVPSPTATASPCPGRSVLVLSNGTGTGPQRLPGEMVPSLGTLQKHWGTNGVGLAHAASTAGGRSLCDGAVVLLAPSNASLVCGAEADSVPGTSGTAGGGWEQKAKDRAPSAERWVPAGSKAASTAGLKSPCCQGLPLTLSPDSRSVHLTALNRVTDPENWEATASVRSPPQSDLGGSSCLSQRPRGKVCADCALLSAGASKRGGKKGLEEDQRSSPSASHTDVLEESSAAGDGRGFAINPTASAADSEAEKSADRCLGAEKAPGSDKMDTAMVANALQERVSSLHRPLEPKLASAVREEVSAPKERPRQQQSSPNGLFPPACRGLAAASPPQQDPLPHGGEAAPPHRSSEQSKRGPIPRRTPCEREGAAAVSGAAESPHGAFKPRCAGEVRKDAGPCPAEAAGSSPADTLVPGDPASTSPSPAHGPKAGLPSAKPGSALGGHRQPHSPGMRPVLAGAPCSCCGCASPGDQATAAAGSREQEPSLHEGSQGGSRVPIARPAPFSAEGFLVPQPLCDQGEAGGPGTDAALHGASREVAEGESPALPFPTSPLHAPRGPSGERLELSDAENGLPRAEQLPGKDRRRGSAFEGLPEPFCSSSDQEYPRGALWPPLPAGASHSTRALGAAGPRTNGDSSSTSSAPTEAGAGRSRGPGEASSRYVPPYVSIRDSQGIARDYQNFVVVAQKCRERPGNSQPPKGRGGCAGQPALSRSLLGTWRGCEELTQHTLDMERLRFHHKLKQILRSGKPPCSTSKSSFPQDLLPQAEPEPSPAREVPLPRSPRSRSPLQVTIVPSDTCPSQLSWHQQSSRHRDTCTPWQDAPSDKSSRAPSRTAGQGHAAPCHLGKLSHQHKLQPPRGDIAVILSEFAELDRAVLSRAEAGSQGRGPAAGPRPRASLGGQVAACEEMIAELRGALRCRLRSVAQEACGRPEMFYLLETGKDPFFARAKVTARRAGGGGDGWPWGGRAGDGQAGSTRPRWHWVPLGREPPLRSQLSSPCQELEPRNCLGWKSPLISSSPPSTARSPRPPPCPPMSSCLPQGRSPSECSRPAPSWDCAWWPCTWSRTWGRCPYVPPPCPS